MKNIKIVIFTYKRNKELLKCLNSVILATNYSKTNVDIIVLDNSPNGEAKLIVEKLNLDFVQYSFCGKKNISAARNHALEFLPESEWQCWLDDDEVVPNDWFQIVQKYICTVSDVSAFVGYVETTYTSSTPEWITSSKIFDRKKQNDLAKISKGGAGNLILNVHKIQEYGIGFDLKYGLTGGEDSKFIMDLNSRGLVVLAAPNCIAYEELSKERSNLKYVVKRAFRGGQTHYRLRIKSKPFINRYVNFILKILENFILLILVVLVFTTSKSLAAKTIQRLAANSGQLVGRIVNPLEIYK